MQVLLERGADPRITTDDGEKPDQVSTSACTTIMSNIYLCVLYRKKICIVYVIEN